MLSIGRSRSDSASEGSEASSAPRPRPSPRLMLMAQHLPCQLEVSSGAGGPEIVKHHRLAVARRLRQTNVPRNDRIEDLPGKVSIDLFADLERETCPAVEHGEYDALDVEAEVQPLSHQLHRLEEVSETLERVELALERDENPIGGNQRVDRQKTERGWTIDDHVVKRRQDRLQRETEPVLALAEADQLDLCANQVDVRGEQPEAAQGRGVDSLLGRLAPQEHVVDRGVEASLADTKPGGRVPLRIEVDEQGRALRQGKAGGEVHGRRSLADPALLVDDRDDLAHQCAAGHAPECSTCNTLYSTHVDIWCPPFHVQHFPQQPPKGQTF